jgi:hypothetical protein
VDGQLVKSAHAAAQKAEPDEGGEKEKPADEH